MVGLKSARDNRFVRRHTASETGHQRSVRATSRRDGKGDRLDLREKRTKNYYRDLAKWQSLFFHQLGHTPQRTDMTLGEGDEKD